MASMFRNNEKYVPYFLKCVDLVKKENKKYNINYIIYTNNNTDKTLNLLTENKNDDITIINNDYSEEFLNKDKITKLYHLREDFLQIIKKETFDYLILFDSDIFFNESIISKSLEIMKKNNFTTATTNTINNKPFYYDLFATIDGEGRKLGTDLKGTYPTIILYLKTLFWRNGIQNVKSAFEGATKFVIDMSPSAPNSKPVPAAFTLRTCPAEPMDVRPVPPNAVPTVSPDWNSANPVATLDALKTTRTGVLSAIS